MELANVLGNGETARRNGLLVSPRLSLLLGVELTEAYKRYVGRGSGPSSAGAQDTCDAMRSVSRVAPVTRLRAWSAAVGRGPSPREDHIVVT